MKTIFTENQIYTVIDVWYEHDDIFRIIARGRVKAHLAKGLDIDDEFIFDMMRLADDGWCRKRVEA